MNPITTSGLTDLAAAAMILHAAHLIRRDGYNPMPWYGEPGHSAESALCEAASCRAEPGVTPGHTPECEALRTRISGYLYLTGRLRRRGYIDDMPGLVSAWEVAQTGGDVPAVLVAAATALAEGGPR